MIRYGLISNEDKKALEGTIDLLINDFADETLSITECGIYQGQTSLGLCTYLKEKNKEHNYTGIDNFKDGEPLIFYPKEAKLINGSSIEVYNQLPDDSQHLIIIDSNHSYPYVVADFMCYAKKVKPNGYIAFHDFAVHAQNVSYQRMGSKDDMDMYISCRRAIENLGVLNGNNTFYNSKWELTFDSVDYSDLGGGFGIFKRVMI